MQVLWVNPNPTPYIANKDLPPVMSCPILLGKEFSLATHIYVGMEHEQRILSEKWIMNEGLERKDD